MRYRWLLPVLLLAALPAAADMFQDGSNNSSPAAVNNIVGGSSKGLPQGVLQTPVLTGQGVNGSVIGYGQHALEDYTPGAPACQDYFEACSHITAIGFNAAGSLTTSDHITALGNHACGAITDAASGISTTCIGIDTMRSATGSANVMVGEHAGTFGGSDSKITGGTFVGSAAGYHVGGTGNTAVGFQAMFANTATRVDGNFNSAFGDMAMREITGIAANNTAVGALAATAITTANSVTVMGYQAGQVFNTSSGHALFGYKAGQNVGEGATESTAFGFQALQGITGTPLTGVFNTAIGPSSLGVLRGAARNNTGLGALSGAALTTGTDNTLLGFRAGQVLTTGINNVIIGSQVASTTLATGSNNIIIGNGVAVDTPAAGTNNTLNIGNVLTAIGISVPATSTSTIAGNLTVTGSLKTSITASPQTANFAVAGDGTSFDNTGATGEVAANLTAAAAGKNACFVVTVAQNIRIRPNAGDKIYLGNAVTLTGTGGGALLNNVIGSTVCLRAQGAGFWYVMSHEGTWTVI